MHYCVLVQGVYTQRLCPRSPSASVLVHSVSVFLLRTPPATPVCALRLRPPPALSACALRLRPPSAPSVCVLRLRPPSASTFVFVCVHLRLRLLPPSTLRTSPSAFLRLGLRLRELPAPASVPSSFVCEHSPASAPCVCVLLRLRL